MKSQFLVRLLLPIAVFISSLASALANETNAEGQTVPWWAPPGTTDSTAFSALILVFLLLFAVFHFYARFDRFAEKHNEGTPLQTTIPMLLMIAFAYEIFPPLSHFSILLPLALIATALARDLMLWFEPMKEHTLKGELEGVMLEELQKSHLGEHDRYGRRVPPVPKGEIVEADQASTPSAAPPKTAPISPAEDQRQASQTVRASDND
jgi:hypothetical protein